VRKEILAKINTILKLNRYRQLRAENSLLQWVLNQSRDAYLVLNADSHIVYANQTARTYLGLDQDQLPQEDVFEIIWRQFNLVPIEAWTQEPAEQTVARYLVRPETAMSPAFWLQFEELPEYEELQNKRVVCLRDVSTQVNTSTEMRKFQTMLSHKLNTPLSGIWGGMQILKHTLQTKPDSEVFDLLYLIESSAHRLKRDISEVLDYTFASSVARHGNNFCLKNLHALLVETISELQIDHFNLAMHSDLSNVSVVLSDKAMYLIVFELLENAKKFHPRRTPSVDISLRQVNNHITMQFTDDGITLSPQQLQAVLRPYTQGEKHFTGEVDGMGLGLSLVSNLVWQSGGEISIKNRSDKPGFEVDMLLPLAASAVVEPQPAQPTEASV
jgi:signal transduction histidine kinase